jgi:transcriptional regulator with XRE-family HTH domain
MMEWDNVARRRAPAPNAQADTDLASSGTADSSGQPSGRAVAEAIWTLTWGRLLRTARQVAGYSLTDLSARTGLSKGYLSKLESGADSAANPSRATLAALARALPSFRPLAHTLAPGLGAEGLVFDGVSPAPFAPPPSPSGDRSAETSVDLAHAIADETPIQIGWRDLEVLAALVTLEAAALAHRVTLPVVARAVGRDTQAVRAVLERLSRLGVVAAVPPVSPGGPSGYRLGTVAEHRLGVARLGDLLLLAAALLSGHSAATNAPDGHASR